MQIKRLLDDREVFERCLLAIDCSMLRALLCVCRAF